MVRGGFPARIAPLGPAATYEPFCGCCFHQLSACALWMMRCPWGISQPGVDQQKTWWLTINFPITQPWFTNLFNDGVYLLATFPSPGSSITSEPPSGSTTAARKDLRSLATSVGSQSISGPRPPLLGQVQLSRYAWSAATLSWKASAVLGLAKNTDLRSFSAKPRWSFCFLSPSSSYSCPGQDRG